MGKVIVQAEHGTGRKLNLERFTWSWSSLIGGEEECSTWIEADPIDPPRIVAVTCYILGPAVQFDLFWLVGRANNPLARIFFLAGNRYGGKPFQGKPVLQDSRCDRDCTDNGKTWLHGYLYPTLLMATP
ncbi:hypothetical protein ACKU3Z_029470 [Pseudomonas aeruginosa]|nr:hypothetical protein [Pseudomonas aeruginosa]